MVTKEKMIYTVRESAEILCVTPRTVRSYIAHRKLRAIQRGDGNYLVHANDLRVFLGLDPDESLVPGSSSCRAGRAGQPHRGTDTESVNE